MVSAPTPTERDKVSQHFEYLKRLKQEGMLLLAGPSLEPPHVGLVILRAVDRPQAERILGDLDNVSLIDPLDYAAFVYLMDRAHLILTDSGGVQEEAPSLGKPVLVMRDTSERMEGVDAGVSRLVTTDPATIVTHVNQLLDSPERYAAMATGKNPYGDGLAARRIIKDLLTWHRSISTYESAVTAAPVAMQLPSSAIG